MYTCVNSFISLDVMHYIEHNAKTKISQFNLGNNDIIAISNVSNE